jgi:hypothetical protein
LGLEMSSVFVVNSGKLPADPHLCYSIFD